MDCPKCGADIPQHDAEECPACGVILSKAVPEPFPHQRFPLHPPQKPVPPRPAISPIAIFGIAIALGALLLGARFIKGKSAAADGWYHGASGYQRALEEQKTSNKPVLLYFHTEWCGWCRKLESDVFATSTFGNRYGSILKVKVNPDDSREERKLADQYAVRGYPTVFVISGGEAREPIVGYEPPDEYLGSLKNVIGN